MRPGGREWAIRIIETFGKPLERLTPLMATSALTASASQLKIGTIKSVVGQTTLVTEYHIGYALRKEK